MSCVLFEGAPFEKLQKGDQEQGHVGHAFLSHQGSTLLQGDFEFATATLPGHSTCRSEEG